MAEGYDIREVLEYLDPAPLQYQDWINVGMALKDAGYTASEWDSWSRRDFSRYKPGECFRKWDGFRGAGTPITVGTIVQLARDQGWTPRRQSADGYELDWDAQIGGSNNDLRIVDAAWVEAKEVAAPETWNPSKELITYLEILFEASENVGYVTESWEKDGKHFPTKGCYDRTAGQLIEQLNKCNGDIGSVLGDYKPEVGAWIRFNPMDGKGAKNENVTDYRFALVESDSTNIDRQNAIIRELELPVACLVHSGKKSLHAIVRIDATSYEEYRKRVDYLYDVCKKNGLTVDTQNKNPSRLSRMPGVMRGGNKQFLVDTNIGKENWNEWREWIESINDDLPEPESLTSVWDALPALSPPLIENVLRQGHKMLLAGPSKAGKSYALIELCIAIAEGRKWLQWPCARGRVLYVNLELDRASCLHRFRDVYDALKCTPAHLDNIDVWNLRGKAVPMDKLAPKLIRRAVKKNYIAIIIDPIYKVITGDENSADQMANFCNQFDRVCSELGAAVVYCHHHSKGSQGQKRSMDRASGSGVFARDPDVLLDLIELDVTDSLRAQEENKVVSAVCAAALEAESKANEASQDDLCSMRAMLEICKEHLSPSSFASLIAKIEEAKKQAAQRSAWRIEGTLREFPKFPPVNLWFDYPVHHLDEVGSLKDVDAGGDMPFYQKGADKNKNQAKKRKLTRRERLENAIAVCELNGATTKNVAEYLDVEPVTVRKWIKEQDEFFIDKNDGFIKMKGQAT
ncbi:AAA family ATPase [Eubacteriales bacterium OttesenSCG-928-K08]|nr:AAA family ATPase [Eubacteriales bacterium OttesenSCG-928-K08]